MPSFGDRKYETTELTPHYAHHPLAPATFLVGNIQRQSFWHSQNHGRVCLTQNTGFNAQDLEADLVTQRGQIQANNTDFGAVARGRRLIPDETTHLIAIVQYFVVAWRQTEIEHQFTVTDSGAASDTVTVTRVLEQDQARQALFRSATGPRNAIAANDRARLVGENPLTGGWLVQEDWIELELANVSISAPGTCLMLVEERANQATANGGSYTEPVHYVPLYTQIWTDMRF